MLIRILKYGFVLGLIFPMFVSAQNDDALQFIQNKGQFDSKVLYRVQLNTGYVFLEQNAITFKLFNEQEYHKAHRHLHDDTLKTDPIIHGHVFKYNFNNSNKAAEVKGQMPFKEKFNYFLGNDKSKWASNVPLFPEVIYKNIYEGINLKVYSKYGQVKYEWMVSPNADVSQIQIELEGLDGVAVKENNLILQTSIGSFADKNLQVFQTSNGLQKDNSQESIPCKYKLLNDQISYLFPKGYNKELPLIIDPILVFSTYSGSRGDNFGYTATFDLRGNLYAGGITDNTHGEYPVTTGAFQTKCKGGKGFEPVNLPCDITISKYDSSGKTLLYATYVGGVEDDYPHSMVVNGDSELVVFGTTYSRDFPMKTNGYDTSHNSYTDTLAYTDIIIFKLSIHGDSLKGATFFGGSNHDGLTDGALKYNYADEFRGEVLTDKANNVYLVSSTNSDSLPLKNASKSSLEGPADGLCLKFSKGLDTLLWSTYFGGKGSDGIYSLEFDKNENIYVAGGTFSYNLPTTSGVFNKTNNGGIDGFMAVYNKKTFALNKATYFGTSAYDQIYFLEIDKLGNVYATGQTEGNITPSKGVYTYTKNSGQFIVMTDSNFSTIKKQTVFGTRANNPNISPSAFLVDSCGNIYISGWGSNVGAGHVGTTTGLPITANALQTATDGSDFYLAVFGKNLSGLLFATYYGGNKSRDHVDGGTSRFDKRGVIYQSVCSSCPNTPGATLNDFPTTSGSAFPKNVSWRCSNAAFKIDFQINNLVKAKFIPDPTLCGPAQIQFTNQSTGNGHYEWDFGDGKTSTLKDPNHSYPNIGKYTLRLIAIDSNTCNVSDTAIKEVTVLQRPTADFVIINSHCKKQVEIINKSKDYTVLDWDYGDGTKDQNPNPGIHTYDTGKYKITLITDAKNLCSDTASVSFEIKEITYAYAKFIPDTTLCGPAEIQFTNQSVGNRIFKWDFGDGNFSTLKNPLHSYPSIGKYTIKLRVTDSATCNISDSITRLVNVLVHPTADFNIKEFKCLSQIDIINKSKDYEILHWDYGDGNSNQNPNPGIYKYPGPGSYKITLVADNTLCSDTLSKTIEIKVNTYVRADFVPDTTLCDTGQVKFINLSSAGNYQWNFGDGNFSSDNSPNHSFTKFGTFNIRLIVNDTNTCNFNDTAFRTVNVVKQSHASFITKGFECISQIEILNTGSDFETTDWDFGDGNTSNNENPGTYEYKDSGIYTIRLITDADKQCPDTAYFLATIKGTPADKFIPVNVFTPDGDGLNECFHFGGFLNECSKFKLIIYDRWGLKMFETTDYNDCWNGRVKNTGRKCPEGTYFYICEYKGETLFIKSRFSGTVTLIRND